MTSHGETADVHVVPPWTSAIDEAAEDDTSAPVLWGTLAAKLEEAADLGSRIMLREAEARVKEGSEAVDEMSREVLLNTCGQLKQCFKKLNRHAQDARFQELCARVVSSSSTAAADPGSSGPTSGSRLVVPPLGRSLWISSTIVSARKWIPYVSGTMIVSGIILADRCLWPWRSTTICACAGKSWSTV